MPARKSDKLSQPTLWRRANYARAREYEKEVYEAKKLRIVSLFTKLKSAPCKRCDQTFPPICMDFHHRNPEDKFKAKHGRRGMFNYAMSVGPAKLLVEIDKCDVICSNCHRIITAEEEHHLNLTS